MAGRRRRGGEGPALPRGTPKDRALRLLGVRWRSREELRRRLTAAGYDPDNDPNKGVNGTDSGTGKTLLARAIHRLSGARAIAATLRPRGVCGEVAGRALEGAGDEGDRARRLASLRAERLTEVEPETAFRRLFGLLVRRGFSPGLAREAAREALRRALSPGSVPDEDP